MLEHIELHHFKSFVSQQISLAPLTICVGANASGKSNLFDAIRFLQGVGTDIPIRDVFEGVWKGGKEVRAPIRGGIKESTYHGQTEFHIESRWSLDRQDDTELIRHRIGCQTTPRALVCEESLKLQGNGKYIFDTEAGALRGATGLDESGGLRVAVRRKGKGNSPTTTHHADRSLLGQLEAMNGMHPDVLPTVNAFKNRLQQSIFLDISPGRMRSYVSKQVDQIGAEGEHLSGMLWNMLEQDRETERDIVDWLAELCSQEFIGIDFVETELGDVMVEVVERGDQHISARSLSDGTLRFLGLIVAILSAEPGSILLLEEIENGLHPSRVHMLVELLEEVTAVRDIQIIATTHSPLVLKSLSEPTLEDVILFARRQQQNRVGSEMRRLDDIPHFHEVIDKKPIDELFTSRWLEKAI